MVCLSTPQRANINIGVEVFAVSDRVAFSYFRRSEQAFGVRVKIWLIAATKLLPIILYQYYVRYYCYYCYYMKCSAEHTRMPKFTANQAECANTATTAGHPSCEVN